MEKDIEIEKERVREGKMDSKEEESKEREARTGMLRKKDRDKEIIIGRENER